MPAETAAASGRIVVIDAFADLPAIRRTLSSREVAADVVRADSIHVAPDIIALMVGPRTTVTERDLDELPNLRVVAATASGFDHLPLDALAARGITATHDVAYATEEVSDHCIALVTALVRHIPRLDAEVHAGHWAAGDLVFKRFADITLGIVGYGLIGSSVARKALGLGMRVVCHTRSLPPPDRNSADVSFLPCLDDLLRASDIVSLHLPLTADTEGIIGAEQLALMRPGASLVNVSRGRLIDMAALRCALEEGRLGSAALDVLPTEPPAAGDPILRLPHTILTPHAAWRSDRSNTSAFEEAAGYVADVLHGVTPRGSLIRTR